MKNQLCQMCHMKESIKGYDLCEGCYGKGFTINKQKDYNNNINRWGAIIAGAIAMGYNNPAFIIFFALGVMFTIKIMLEGD